MVVWSPVDRLAEALSCPAPGTPPPINSLCHIGGTTCTINPAWLPLPSLHHMGTPWTTNTAWPPHIATGDNLTA